MCFCWFIVYLDFAAIHDLSDVVVAVHDLTSWKLLGLQLGLFHSTLTSIEKDRHYNTADCMMEMLAAWLKMQDNVLKKGVPSWLRLKNALRRMGEKTMADRISF